MGFEFLRLIPDPEKSQPLSGRNDFELYYAFRNGEIQKGAILEITTQEISLDDDGKGALVVHVASAVYDYPSMKPQFEHLFLSQDGKIDSIRQKNLTSWKVVGRMSEEEFDRRSNEINDNR